tara:strand:- start:20506 stop:21549 length:1044 start_codon:yes stop_codon:yes gene_type:complete
MNILITGGAGFIGSHLVRLMTKKYPKYNIFNLDILTYAGNLENLKDIELYPNYKFIKCDLRNLNDLQKIFNEYQFDGIIHLAAESHVDRSIHDPISFVETNVIGTVNLLNVAKDQWGKDFSSKRFYHVSTDEVYGSLGDTGLFTEKTAYDPRSPYSASKASSDHFVRAYGETYKLPYVISNCSNNYGEYHFPEKFIPLLINNILNNKKLPIYGDGNFTRDWLYVRDHVNAIDLIFHKSKNFETYNIGGFNEIKNIDLVKILCEKMDFKLGRKSGTSNKLITFIKDRPGHDRRYAIDAEKINTDLGWSPSVNFDQGISLTIEWYLKNQKWLKNVISGDYKEYYNKQYK